VNLAAYIIIDVNTLVDVTVEAAGGGGFEGLGF
jgi:hypothetical protein